MARWIALPLAVLGADPTGALAEDRPIALDLHGPGPLPFTRGELVSALEARTRLAPEDPAAVPVQIAADENGLEIRAMGRSERLRVSGDGEEAARVVALVAIDLARQPASVPRPLEIVALRSPPAGARTSAPFALSLSGGIEGGVSNASPDPELQLGFTRELRGALSGWAALVQVGYSYGRSDDDPIVRNTGLSRMTAHTIPVRVGLLRPSPVLAIGGGLGARTLMVVGNEIADGDGFRVLPGAFVMAQTRVPVSARFALLASVGLDAHPWTHTVRRWNRSPEPGRHMRRTFVLETRHFVPWATLGVQWR